jgi:hypothetical protein
VEYSCPGPPSSQTVSRAHLHALVHAPGCEGGGEGEAVAITHRRFHPVVQPAPQSACST